MDAIYTKIVYTFIDEEWILSLNIVPSKPLFFITLTTKEIVGEDWLQGKYDPT